MESVENGRTLSKRFDKHLYTKHPNNEEVFNILNLCIEFLNLQTVSEYAKENNISPQAVYQNRKTLTILGVKCLINNH